MKAIGALLAVFGGLMIVTAIVLTVIGRFNLSDSAGLQQFIGAMAGGVIVLAIGMKLANPKPPSDQH